jgi:hypothetical protein
MTGHLKRTRPLHEAVPGALRSCSASRAVGDRWRRGLRFGVIVL